MQKLLPLLLLLITLSVQAQDYELFPRPNDTLAFENSRGNVVFIAFDSISTNHTYWPQRETHIDRINNSGNCVGYLYDTAWCGYKIEQLMPSVYAFNHTNYSFAIDLTKRNNHADSIGWLQYFNQPYVITSTFFSKSYKVLFNNQADSVLSFEFKILDTNGQIKTINQTNSLFEVSKSNGLVSMPLLYMSDHYDDPAQGASRNFSRSNFKPLARMDIYDFKPGDKFHYSHATYNIDQPWNRVFTHSNLQIISKSIITADSIIYKAARTYTRKEVNYQLNPPQMEEKIFKDTINLNFGRINDLMTNQLTYQSQITSPSVWPGYTTSFWLNNYRFRIGDSAIYQPGVYTSSNHYERDSSCILMPFEPSPEEALYLRSLGRVKYYKVSFPKVYEEYLIYYQSSNGQSWGKPYNINLDELAIEEVLQIYPNPSSDILYIDLPLQLRSTVVIVIDQLGRKVLEKEINEDNSSISVANLSPGTYFIKLENGRTIPFVKQ